MLQEYQQIKISEYQNLYDRLIPEDHVLRKFNNLVDFSFVRDELEHKYCLDNGRNAISPVMLFKYLTQTSHSQTHRNPLQIVALRHKNSCHAHFFRAFVQISGRSFIKD